LEKVKKRKSIKKLIEKERVEINGNSEEVNYYKNKCNVKQKRVLGIENKTKLNSIKTC
jgi:ribosomal 50S subunit-recycling heat shock protein